MKVKKNVSSLESQAKFVNVSKVEGSKEQWRNLSLQMRLKNITKKKSLMCMNIFQPSL
jgi:hypothetical protein